MTQPNLSARKYHGILKLARTIADLAGYEEIQSVHLAALKVCFAKVLHAAQPSQVDNELKVDTISKFRNGTEKTIIQFL